MAVDVLADVAEAALARPELADARTDVAQDAPIREWARIMVDDAHS